MIRRDYFIRMVQELTQALTRMVFFRKAQNYPHAIQEFKRALSRFWNLTPEQIGNFSIEQWIEKCREEEGPMGEKLVALADLFKEQGEIEGAAEQAEIGLRSSTIALGLYLEAVTSPDTIISVDLLGKIEELIERTSGSRLPAEVLRRLLSYYETRGMLDKAEDVLFDWLDTRDPAAPKAGLSFYTRLETRTDQELERCGLPRAEVEEGREEVRRMTNDQITQ